MSQAVSKHGVLIRLPAERWLHITQGHPELAGYFYDVLGAVQDPDGVYMGRRGEYLAVKEVEPGKYLVVVYREITVDDGFVITAFFTRRRSVFERRARVWP